MLKIKVSDVLNTRLEMVKAQYRHAWKIENDLMGKWIEAWGDPDQPAEIYEGIGELHSRASRATMKLRAKVEAYEEMIAAVKTVEEFNEASEETDDEGNS